MRTLLPILTLSALTACTTPYSPAVLVNGSDSFVGIGGLLEKSTTVDVVMVHGMCTHTRQDAEGAMSEIMRALRGNLVPADRPRARAELGVGALPEIEVFEGEGQVAGNTIRFTGLVWSPLTKLLKDQLLYDNTGIANDCATAEPGTCKPVRARLNAFAKDWLLNDCLADALAYQGKSLVPIRDAMMRALTDVILERDSSDQLVVVSASLGSKIVFDALREMLRKAEDHRSTDTRNRAALDRLRQRLAIVYMEANQMPILGLADQDIRETAVSGRSIAPPLATLLEPLERLAATRSVAFEEITVVAFTDPNDVLSYRLLGSRFAGLQRVKLADVVVSNSSTWLGLFENPLTAHLGYGKNKDVARMISCGAPKESVRCQ